MTNISELQETATQTRHPLCGPSAVQHLLTSPRFLFAVAALWTLFLAWKHRFAVNPDGLSYIDMAANMLHRGPGYLVNAHWSPLYPFLIGIVSRAFHPSLVFESTAVHLLNWAIFIAVTESFMLLLSSWSPVSKRVYGTLEAFAFAVFFWSVIRFISVATITPDLLVAGAVFTAAALVYRIHTRPSGIKDYCWLGLVLGAGYYAKAAMFPIGLILLALLLIIPPRHASARLRVVIAAVVFAGVAAPLVFLSSRRVGYPSIGEAGHLNYLWHINGLPYAGWTGHPAGRNGVPTHPPVIIREEPLTIGFREPIPATYPLWYDPFYWFTGARSYVNAAQIVGNIKENLHAYGVLVYDMAAIPAGLLVILSIAGLSQIRRIRCDRASAVLFVWILAVCIMFALVRVEGRYICAFAVLLWLCAYRLISERVAVAQSRAVLSTVACALVLPLAMHSPVRELHLDHHAIAGQLSRAGVGSGARLAVVGPAFDTYYVRLLGARVIAEIPNKISFYSVAPSTLSSVTSDLARYGVTAIVAPDPPPGFRPDGWSDVNVPGGGHFSVLSLYHARVN